MSRRKVLVKRLVCIEDLGDIDVLFTDKTGTLTQGRIDFMRAVPLPGTPAEEVLHRGLLCTESDVDDQGRPVGGNPLDDALWDSPAAAAQRPVLSGWTRTGVLPFDHERRMVTVTDPAGDTLLITKGAPETVLERCTEVPEQVPEALDAEFAAGDRVVAVATRPAHPATALSAADERDLRPTGLLVFLDPPKHDAADALGRLHALDITTKMVTGDNPAVAAKVCHDLGLTAPPSSTPAGSWSPSPHRPW